ncbi:MAG: hypothetical protein LAT78_08470 [Roseinatronobacter sp.]|jgi:hypothetical protein|nr:hypothetical protein [Roseinatronobacter sp.]
MQVVTQKAQGQIPLQDYTVARVLREIYPNAKLRAGFRTQPYLDSVKIGDVLATGLSIEKFFSDCRSLPSCGEVQIKRLRGILEDLATRIATQPSPEKPQALKDGPTDALPFNGQIYPDFISAWERVYQRMWRLAHFEKFVYLPSSVPEFVKSPTVLRAELTPETDLSGYMDSLSGLRSALRLFTSASGLVVLDKSRLDMLFERRGVYAGLSPQELDEQRVLLVHMIDSLSSGIAFKVLNTEAAHLSSGCIMGELITLSTMGGYLVTRDPTLATLLEKRAYAATQSAMSLSDYLHNL